MKKVFKIFIVITAFFLCATNVYAESCELSDEKGFCLDMTKHDIINGDGEKYFGEDAEKPSGNTYFKVTDENDIIYCSNVALSTNHLNKDLEPIDQNCREKSNIEKIAIYLYEYGYGNNLEAGKYKFNSKYLYGNDKFKDYYITQNAVWYFYPPNDDPGDEWLIDPNSGGINWNTFWFNAGYDFEKGTYYGKNYDMVTKISALVMDAKSASNAVPKLELNASNLDMKVSSDGKYYISDPISLKGEYLTEEISLLITGISDAFVTTNKEDTTGINKLSDGTNPSINETLYIKVPVTSIKNEEIKITLKVTSKSTFTDESNIIECAPGVNSYDQSMIKYNPKEITLSEEISITANKYPIKVSKTDAKGNYLNGATLVIKQDGKVIETWTTTSDVKTILLAPGIYTLSELNAPDGYILNKEEVTFTVTNNNTSEVVNIINEPIIVKISKRKVKDDTELSGATLKITDEDGNTLKDINGNDLQWVTGDEPKSFHLGKGTYVLEEVSSPDGYELSDKKIKFDVNEDGTVSITEGLLIKKDVTVENNLIIFENSPVPTQVPTGDYMLYIAITLCMLSLGVSTYFILKRKEI